MVEPLFIVVALEGFMAKTVARRGCYAIHQEYACIQMMIVCQGYSPITTNHVSYVLFTTGPLALNAVSEEAATPSLSLVFVPGEHK